MNILRTITATCLLAASSAVSANLIWDMRIGGVSGTFTTQGNLDADGYGGGRIIASNITGSTDPNVTFGLPTWGIVGTVFYRFWDDDSVRRSYFETEEDIDLLADLLIKINVGGTELLHKYTMAITQDLVGPGEIPDALDSLELWHMEYRALGECARDSGELLGSGQALGADFCPHNASDAISLSRPRQVVPTPESLGLFLFGLIVLWVQSRRGLGRR